MLETHLSETPVFVRSGDQDIFGVLTSPAATSRGTAVLFITGGELPCTNQNRIFVDLARMSAGLGYHGFRFDFMGVGDSSGVAEQFRLDRPLVEDINASIEWLKSRGIEQVILLGSCFGARNAVMCALENPSVRGLILVSSPIRDSKMYLVKRDQSIGEVVDYYRKRATVKSIAVALMTPRTRKRHFSIIKAKAMASGSNAWKRVTTGKPSEFSWVSTHFLGPMRRLAKTDIPVLMLYGDDEPFYLDFKRVRDAGLLKDGLGAGRAEVQLIPGDLHGFPSLQSQAMTLELVERWLSGRAH